MAPNPAFKSTSRTTSIFSKVKGFVWVDDESHQMARVQGEVTDDISLGLFLAKINKGSRFLQDRYELTPGLWLPSFTQYDFDGRKFFSSFGVHEKTYYSGYRRIGTPAEAIPVIQSEIARLGSVKDSTKDKTFELTPPSGVDQAPDLVSGRSIPLGAPIKIGPRSTVVLYLPQ